MSFYCHLVRLENSFWQISNLHVSLCNSFINYSRHCTPLFSNNVLHRRKILSAISRTTYKISYPKYPLYRRNSFPQCNVKLVKYGTGISQNFPVPSVRRKWARGNVLQTVVLLHDKLQDRLDFSWWLIWSTCSVAAHEHVEGIHYLSKFIPSLDGLRSFRYNPRLNVRTLFYNIEQHRRPVMSKKGIHFPTFVSPLHLLRKLVDW